MSFAGFKKQLNKANQFVSEKVGGAKGTEHDRDFIEMERKADELSKLYDEMASKTTEYLQPNPASRAKMQLSKMRGTNARTEYPQPEYNLGDVMVRHGMALTDSSFGEALIEAGESFKRLAEIKYTLEGNVKQNFLSPIDNVKNTDIKQVMHHRKKLESRRLDYDCKMRKQAKGSNVTQDELENAHDKFNESLKDAKTAMHNLISNEVEQISQLSAFVDAQYEYHREAMQIMEALKSELQDKTQDAGSRPRRAPDLTRESRIASKTSDSGDWPVPAETNSSSAAGNRPMSTVDRISAAPGGGGGLTRLSAVPSCRANFDFEPEADGELGFREGDVIQLLSRIDENWYEGSLNGRTGYFPVNYVDVITPLP